MTSNIQKAFKTKSKLRAMADGGPVRPVPEMLGSGMVQRAGSALQGRRAQIDAAIDAASGASPPRPAPTAPVTAAPAKKKPEEKSALRSFFGLADGGSTSDVDWAMGSRGTNRFASSADDMAPPELELADGGKVKGKGGPTDDKVGPVMLSDGEYVLPADTVEIVGRDKLDALRLATHEFVDDRNKPKVSGLRKMANGGVFYVDPEGVASRQLPPGRAVVPYQPPPTSAQPPGSQRPPTTTSSLRTPPVEAPQGRAYRVGRAVAGGMAATAPLAGFGDYKADTGGVDTSASGTLGYLLKGEFGNAGTSLSGGAAEVLADSGRGVAKTADWVAGLFGANPDLTGRYDRAVTDLFGGYLSLRNPEKVGPADSAAPDPSPPADVRTSSAGMPATPVPPQSYQSRRLAEMGVPVGQQNLPPVTEDTRRSLLRAGGGTPGQYVNLGSSGGDTNIYGTASKPGGRIDSFVGVGASSRPGGGPQEDPIMGEIRSALRGLTAGTNDRGGEGGGPTMSGFGSTSDINARYDALLRGGSGRNIVRGLDWSQRHGLDVERARATELGELARNQPTLRGQDVQASTAANDARMRALQTLGTMVNQRSTQLARAQADMLKALQDAQKADETRDERGLTDIREAVRARFGDDSALAESVLSRILSAGSDQIGAVTRLTGQERAKAIEDLLDSALLAQQFDAAQNPLWGNTDAGLPRAVEVRDPRFFRDVGSGAAVLPALGREVKDLFGFDGRVMVDDNGRVAPYPKDLRSRRVVRNAEADAPRRSRLRSERED